MPFYYKFPADGFYKEAETETGFWEASETELKECYICMETSPEDLFKETCGNKNHEVCEKCSARLESNCPMCRKKLVNAKEE
jgi:hypothetical protein